MTKRINYMRLQSVSDLIIRRPLTDLVGVHMHYEALFHTGQNRVSIRLRGCVEA